LTTGHDTRPGYADHRFASLRFDHSLYLALKDESLELSFGGIANDIHAAIRHVEEHFA